MAKVCETKVSENNSTAVPKPFRTDTGTGEGDVLEWHTIDGEWVVRKKDDGGVE